jgi:hypothetical protein
LGREPPDDTAGAAQFLVPISNYNGLPFFLKSGKQIIFNRHGGRRYERTAKLPWRLDKDLLAYLYIIVVFLYSEGRGWPLSGWPRFCV